MRNGMLRKANSTVFQIDGTHYVINIGFRKHNVIQEDIIPGVCSRIIEGIRTVGQDIRERLSLRDNCSAFIEAAIVRAELPHFQVV